MPQRRPAAALAAGAVAAALGACRVALGQVSPDGAAQPVASVPWQAGPVKYEVQVPGTPGGRPTLSLYPGGGVVAVSTGQSLMAELQDPALGGTRWFFVELYDHMCPHCWYAVPVVTGVAGAFEGAPDLKVTSLNCHMSSNAEACFFLELISGAQDYPTFLLCPPGGIDATSPESLPPRARGIFSRLGGAQRDTFMALMRCRTRFIESAVKSGQEDPFLSARVVAEWVLAQTTAQLTQPQKLMEGADFTDMSEPDPTAPPGRPGWLTDDKDGAPGVPAWVPGQRWFDALRGFVHALHNSYRAERHKDAVDSALFLARVFPVKGKALLQLGTKLQEVAPFEQLADFQQLLSQWAQGAGIPGPDDEETGQEYMTCEGSSCAMWTLLHTVVAAVAVRGISGRPLLGDESLSADEDPTHFVGVHLTLSFVRRFVTSFLNCRPCKETFLLEYARCEYGRCQLHDDYRGMALWLWRKHNAISLRVARQSHAEVDRRWPMYQDCPACWKRELVMTGKMGPESSRRLAKVWDQEELDAPFQTDHVFWHLVRTYVGLTRVQLEMEDLQPDEQLQVQSVLRKDHQNEANAYHGRSPEQEGIVQQPPDHPLLSPEALARLSEGGNMGGIALLLAVGIVASLLFCGSRLISSTGFRASRSPPLRASGAPGAEEDDEDLVPAAAFGGKVAMHESLTEHDDPAAE